MGVVIARDGDPCNGQLFLFCLGYQPFLEDYVNCANDRNASSCAAVGASILAGPFAKLSSKALARILGLTDDFTFAKIGADFIENYGRRYDQMGNGARAGRQNIDEFLESFDWHIYGKPDNDFTVVYLTGYSIEFAAKVRASYDELPLEVKAKILRIGW